MSVLKYVTELIHCHFSVCLGLVLDFDSCAPTPAARNIYKSLNPRRPLQLLHHGDITLQASSRFPHRIRVRRRKRARTGSPVARKCNVDVFIKRYEYQAETSHEAD
jgi:hypothetical protein